MLSTLGQSTTNQYVKQLVKYMEQIARSVKPSYIGYEYYGPDAEDYDCPEQIYSLVYRNKTSTLVINFYDKNLREMGAWPYFSTTYPAHSIGNIKVGASMNVLKKSTFYKIDNSRHYQSFYDGSVINVYYNKKGIITRIEYRYEEPVADDAMKFINGKVKANLK